MIIVIVWRVKRNQQSIWWHFECPSIGLQPSCDRGTGREGRESPKTGNPTAVAQTNNYKQQTDPVNGRTQVQSASAFASASALYVSSRPIAAKCNKVDPIDRSCNDLEQSMHHSHRHRHRHCHPPASLVTSSSTIDIIKGFVNKTTTKAKVTFATCNWQIK